MIVGVDATIKQLVGGTHKIVIAIDGCRVRFQRTIRVHFGKSGELCYDTFSVGSLKYPRKFRTALLQLIEEHSETEGK